MALSSSLSSDPEFYKQLFVDSYGATLVVAVPSMTLLCVTDVTAQMLGVSADQLSAGSSEYRSQPLFQELQSRMEQIRARKQLQFDLDWDSDSSVHALIRVYVRQFEFAGRQLLRVYLRDLGQSAPERERLRELNERLSLATEAAGSGIWDLDLVNGHLEWDAQQHRLFGTDPVTFTGTYEDWRGAVHPDDNDRAAAEVEQAVADKALFHTEFRVVWPDGQVRHIEAHALPQYDDSGNPVRMVGVNWDITERKLAEQALASAHAKLESLFNAAIDVCILATDPQGKITMFNPGAEKMLGYQAEAMIGVDLEQLLPETELKSKCGQFGCGPCQSANELFHSYANHQHELSESEREWWLLTSDGGQLLTDLMISPILADGIGLGGLLFIALDITSRKKNEQVMRQAAALFDFSPEAIVATDPDGVIKMVNRAFTLTTGYSSEEAIGCSTRMLKSSRHDQRFYAEMWGQLKREGSWEGEIWNRRKNGEVYPEWQTIKAIYNDAGEVAEYIAMFNDITDRKRQEQRIWRQANYDSLTGLANRNRLESCTLELVDRLNGSDGVAGLLFVDLDRFKVINDSLGHEAGDRLLIEAARRLQECVAERGVVARIGGDEFGILLESTDSSELYELCELIIKENAEPYPVNGLLLQLGCSIGAAVFPQDGIDFSTLLKKADIAMSKAKREGADRYRFFSETMHDELISRIEIERDLRRALEQQEFELYYQPIVDVNNGAIVGAESLIRWNDPDKGLISPYHFIPVAEECGLIVEIGAWVLEQAVEQLSNWQRQGLDLRLSVNVSSIQFQQPDFVNQLFALLKQYEFDRNKLVLEVTESVLIDNVRSVEQRMEQIRAEGVRFALDDFGTGYSSLSYLKSLKADYVKVDRSFITECTQNPSDAHLVQAIVNLASGLELKVIAEGVETESQLAFLKGSNCAFYQGYLESPPVPIGEFQTLLANQA